jgi:hypothetical protein
MIHCLLLGIAVVVSLDDSRSEDIAELMFQIDSVTEHRWHIEFDSELDSLVATSIEEVPEELPTLIELVRPEELANQKLRSLEFRIGLALPQDDAVRAEYKRVSDDLSRLRELASDQVKFHLGLSKIGFKRLSKEDYKTVIRFRELEKTQRRLEPPKYSFRALLLQAPIESGRSEAALLLHSDVLKIYELLETLSN